MRIAFIDTYPIRRGAQVFISELSDYLSKLGYSTKRIYLYKKVENQETVNIRPIDTVLDFSPDHFFEKIPTIQPLLLNQLIKEVKQFEPDIVLLNGSRTLKYGALAKQFLGARIKWVSRVIDNAEFWNTGNFTYWYYKYLVIPQIDGSVGVSRASLNSMINHYNFIGPSIVIHRVFDSAKFQNAPTREEARRILGFKENDEVLLFLGNLTSQKRPERFIAVAQKLLKSRPGIKGLLVGDGPLRESLESKVSTTQSSIVFYGYQSDVASYLASADILVLTSDTEGLPGVVLEAAYFSVPTVSTDVGGIRECLIEGKTGYLIEDRSIGEFCKKITRLLENQSFRNNIGYAAKKFVAKNFQMENAAKEYIQFFNKVLIK